MNINPFQEDSGKQPFFNRLVQGFTGMKRKNSIKRTASATEKLIENRRVKNKAARKARRKNRIVAKNLHHKFKG